MRSQITVVGSSSFPGRKEMLCSCFFFQRRRFPCRHMYCLLGRPPSVEDFHPCHLLKYEKHGFLNDLYFRECQSQMDALDHCFGFLLESAFNVLVHVRDTKESDDCAFFKRVSACIYMLSSPGGKKSYPLLSTLHRA